MSGWLSFLALAAALLFFARMVVTSGDLVHAVLWLGATLIATAALYVTLHADFLAAVQVLLYTGGVITLMLFGVMLTRRLTVARVENPATGRWRAGLTAAAAFAVVALAIARAGRGFALSEAPPALEPDTRALGALFLTELALPFEALSVLLLAAMIGAIVLARRTDP